MREITLYVGEELYFVFFVNLHGIQVLHVHAHVRQKDQQKTFFFV